MTISVGRPNVGEQLRELVAHRRLRVGVERRERLVEQQHAGLARQRPGQRDALALAARELLGGRAAARWAIRESLEQLVDARRAAVGDVLAHRHVRKQRVLLEDEADAAPVGRAEDAPLRSRARPRRRARPGRSAGAARPAITASTVDLPGARRADQRDDAVDLEL